MKNVVVLCVVYASLVSAGFFTPSPDKHVIKKEGVVIGIEDDDNGNTKVKISPHEVDPHREGVLASAKEKIKEAASNVVPEMMKKGGDNVNQEKDDKIRPGEKINSYTAKTKEATNEAVKEGIGKVKDSVAEVSQKSKEKGKAAEEKVRTQGKGLKRVFWYLISPVQLHLLGFATAYGMCVWVTLGSNYVLGKALPRQQLATVQSRVYPLYLKAMASSVGLAFLGSIMDRTTPFDLVASLLMILVNLLYLEPRATKVGLVISVSSYVSLSMFH